MGIFTEIFYNIFLWTLFSCVLVHIFAAAIAFCRLRQHKIGRWMPLLIIVMGFLSPLTGGAISSKFLHIKLNSLLQCTCNGCKNLTYIIHEFSMLCWSAKPTTIFIFKKQLYFPEVSSLRDNNYLNKIVISCFLVYCIHLLHTYIMKY